MFRVFFEVFYVIVRDKKLYVIEEIFFDFLVEMYSK